MEESRLTWSEEASNAYRRIAAIAVPHRRDQLAALLTLIPFGVMDEFQAVELGSGEGRLAAAILEAFPNARIMALDGSASMREATAERLQHFPDRFDIDTFDLLRPDWYSHLDNARLVVSSLVVHHLDGPGKQSLFKAVRTRMADRGAFLTADLLFPKRAEARELFAATYDQSARSQSFEITGSDGYYQDFVQLEWNFFRYPDDPADKPSPLYEQLRWLDEAGFEEVDCFWLHAGHAIYGGYTGKSKSDTSLEYERAYEIATKAIE